MKLSGLNRTSMDAFLMNYIKSLHINK